MNHVMLHQNANVSALNKVKSSVIVFIGDVTQVSVKKLKSKKLKFPEFVALFHSSRDETYTQLALSISISSPITIRYTTSHSQRRVTRTTITWRFHWRIQCWLFQYRRNKRRYPKFGCSRIVECIP